MVKKVNGIAAIALAVIMVLSMAACGQQTNAPAPAKESYKAGTYTGTGQGHGGPIQVKTTFTADAITTVEVVKQTETQGIADPAFTVIPDEIVKYQALGVDTVTGATLSSYGIINAVADCVKQAGGDSDALKAKKQPAPTPGPDVEKSADVIVIGGGGAGLSASVSALQNKASVILVEKGAAVGGNTLVSGGVWNAADPELAAKTPNDKGRIETLKSFLDKNEKDVGDYAETLKTLKAQIRKYLAGDTSKLFDSTELHIMQTYYGGLRQDLDGKWISGNFELVKNLCTKSLETRKWAESLGTVFAPALNEPIGSLWKRALAPAKGNFEGYIKVFSNNIIKNGGEIMLDTTAKELIVENGRVTGVKAVKKDGTKVTLHANKGVVMATGGFGGNKEMVLKYNNYWKDLNPKILTTNRETLIQGDGIVMGEKAGAAVTGMGFIQLMPLGWANTGELAGGNGSYCIYITPQGKRFVNEYAERDVISKAAIEHGELFYELQSQKSFMGFGTIEESSVVFKADTLEELAKKLGMDANTLTQEVNKYNSYVDAGKDPDFGKNVFTAKIEAPYVARAMKPSIHHTMGGLVVDVDAHVIDTKGKVIPGFYAAGEVTGGLHAGNRLGGNAIADIFTNGRIAGANAALGK
ncbi:MAG: FAD-dependent oxidoreductase [Clostridiales bacterium]|jgi:fumarate reductase flavoprotein subunit|nr:FAD-dependent oxidoreductase [Eubacteriales bacterium]MDH7565275.1 FAD-dependent oxidoreductase [Clostridiales bacterium]